MKPSQACYDLIAHFESFRSSPYVCPAGITTIGYGTTFWPNGKRVKTTDHPITQTKAMAMLKNDCDRFAYAVDLFVLVPLQQCMFDALVSLVYNIGIDAFKNSTLLRLLNNGDYIGASKEFAKWNKAKGRVLDGLVKRREAEATMFCGGNQFA